MVNNRSEGRIERLQYWLASSQEDRFSYFFWAVFETFLLWVLMLVLIATILELANMNPDTSWNWMLLLFVSMFVLFQSVWIYKYRSESKYVFQNANRMSGGPETERLLKKKRVTVPHDLTTYYWQHFEACRRNAGTVVDGRLDALFELVKNGVSDLAKEEIDIDTIADAIELDLTKKVAAYKITESDAWKPYFQYANEQIDEFGDSEIVVESWLKSLLTRYEKLDPEIRRITNLQEESRFARFKDEIERHTGFYSLVFKFVGLVAILILLLIFGPEPVNILRPLIP